MLTLNVRLGRVPAVTKALVMLSGALSGCAAAHITLDSPPPPIEAFTYRYDNERCHDVWPRIDVAADPIASAMTSNTTWAVSYPAQEMLRTVASQREAAGRCKHAIDDERTLRIRPTGLSLASHFGISPRRHYSSAYLTLEVDLINSSGHKLTTWEIVPGRIGADSVFLDGSRLMPRGRLPDLEPTYTALTFGAMHISLAMALECFRLMDGRPMVLGELFEVSEYQCLPSDPTRLGVPNKISEYQRIDSSLWPIED